MSYRPDSLKSFVGQRTILRRIIKQIKQSKLSDLPLGNILLLGPSGMGKTVLLELIAKEIGYTFEIFDCSQFRDKNRLLIAIDNYTSNQFQKHNNTILVFDEIHMMANEAQIRLSTLLSNYKNGNELCRNISIIAAGPSNNELSVKLIKLFPTKIYILGGYSKMEMMRICHLIVLTKKFGFTLSAMNQCIIRSKNSIRGLVENIEELCIFHSKAKKEENRIRGKEARLFFANEKIDKIGLNEKDYMILNTLLMQKKRGLAITDIAIACGLDIPQYQSEYEYYLFKKRMIKKKNDRILITRKGELYFKKNVNTKAEKRA